MNTKNLFCREVMLGSEELIIPRTTYQRPPERGPGPQDRRRVR